MVWSMSEHFPESSAEARAKRDAQTRSRAAVNTDTGVTRRVLSKVNRNEEDLGDWMRGDGQLWMGLLAFAFLAFFVYELIAGFVS